MKNKVMLITYPDCMGNNLKDLKRMLDMYFAEAISGVHILPFPSQEIGGLLQLIISR